MTKFRVNEHVRVKGMPLGSADEFARIDYITSKGMYKVTNINMPYMGSINELMTADQIEKIKHG